MFFFANNKHHATKNHSSFLQGSASKHIVQNLRVHGWGPGTLRVWQSFSFRLILRVDSTFSNLRCVRFAGAGHNTWKPIRDLKISLPQKALNALKAKHRVHIFLIWRSVQIRNLKREPTPLCFASLWSPSRRSRGGDLGKTRPVTSRVGALGASRAWNSRRLGEVQKYSVLRPVALWKYYLRYSWGHVPT